MCWAFECNEERYDIDIIAATIVKGAIFTQTKKKRNERRNRKIILKEYTNIVRRRKISIKISNNLLKIYKKTSNVYIMTMSELDEML